MPTKRIPVVVYAENTPNPNMMKFVVNTLLIDNGINIEYSDASQTKGAPLAQKLFNFPFVSRLYFAGNFITVNKTDAIGWDMVVLELREFIQLYLSEGNPVFTEVPQADNTSTEFAAQEAIKHDHAPASTEIEHRIIDLLEEYVRPAVEQDGGAIFFHSFNDGIVKVSLKGACSGCPSSTLTLKAGIEGLLKRMIPEVQEVVSEAC